MNKIDKKIQELLDLSSDGIHILDKNGYVIQHNKSFAKMLGYTSEEINSLNVKDFDIQFEKNELIDLINNSIKNLINDENNICTKHLKKDGTIIDVKVNIKSVKINEESFLYASSRDITKEKLYEEQLEKQKNELEFEKTKLQIILRNIPELLWMKDSYGKYIACNKRFEDFIGLEENEIVGKTDYDLVDKDLADFFREHDKETMNSKTALSNFEEIKFAIDGHKEYLNTTKVKILDDKDNILGVLGLGTNITELKKSQEELQNEKTKYKILMEYSSDAIFIINLDGFVVENNKLFRDSLGYEDSEVLKLHVSDFEAVHTKEQIKENIKNISFEPLYFESKYKRKNGTLFDVSISIIRVIIDKQEYIYSSFRNITQQKKLQNNILKQKEEFETIFDYSHDGIAIIDLNKNFIKFNTSFLNMVEYTKEELLTKSCKDLTAIEDLQRNESALERVIRDGHIDNFEKSCITKSGKKISVNMSASLLPDKKTILLSMKDISTLKIMEEQSKLASMGEMIGNIAHQWRQPLSVITTSISGLKLKSDFLDIDKNDIDECEKNILKQTNYLSETIDNFRNFIKGDKIYDEISLKAVLENAISLVYSSLHNNFINVITNLEDDLKIFGNKSELAEAFINMLNNSKDALKSNIKDESDRLIFINTKLLNENTIEVKILDSGKGIKEDILKKIFEPYFSTKHQSQGTGLGLAMADKIIRERHGGKIMVLNEEFEYNGKKYFGASFKIIFTSNK